ncbi:MAG TPA: GlsB/YeaQ/YmgE family stress response membrane protein [Rhizomicrobium sp.]
MSVLGWLFFGAITGWLASLIVNKRGEGCILNIALGLVGALVGGLVFRAISDFDVFGFNPTSMVVAILGAVIALFLWNAVTGRRTLR